MFVDKGGRKDRQKKKKGKGAIKTIYFYFKASW